MGNTRPGDCGPAARAEFFLDGIAVGEDGFEAVEKVWHCVLARLVTVLEYGLRFKTARQGEDEPTSLNKHSSFLIEGPCHRSPSPPPPKIAESPRSQNASCPTGGW